MSKDADRSNKKNSELLSELIKWRTLGTLTRLGPVKGQE